MMENKEQAVIEKVKSTSLLGAVLLCCPLDMRFTASVRCNQATHDSNSFLLPERAEATCQVLRR